MGERFSHHVRVPVLRGLRIEKQAQRLHVPLPLIPGSASLALCSASLRQVTHTGLSGTQSRRSSHSSGYPPNLSPLTVPMPEEPSRQSGWQSSSLEGGKCNRGLCSFRREPFIMKCSGAWWYGKWCCQCFLAICDEVTAWDIYGLSQWWNHLAWKWGPSFFFQLIFWLTLRLFCF